jgi:hypothetical protein
VRSVRDQIVSGVVRPHPTVLREDPPVAQHPSTRAPTKKKKKRPPAQQQHQPEGSPREGRPLRRSKAAPSPRPPQERTSSVSRSRSKSVSKKPKPPGPVDSQRHASPRRNPSVTSKAGRRPMARPEEQITPKAIRKALVMGTPKASRKAATRPGTPAGLTPRKATARTPGTAPKVARKASMSRPPPTTPRKQNSMPMVPRTPKTPKTPRRSQSARPGEEAADRPRQTPRSSGVVRKPKLKAAQQRMSQSFSDFRTTKAPGPRSFDSQGDLAYAPETPSKSSGPVRKKKVKGMLLERRHFCQKAAFYVPNSHSMLSILTRSPLGTSRIGQAPYSIQRAPPKCSLEANSRGWALPQIFAFCRPYRQPCECICWENRILGDSAAPFL